MKGREIEEIKGSSRGDVYAQYCGYNTKMEGYTKFVYTAQLE
jgi:hypothetical protein